MTLGSIAWTEEINVIEAGPHHRVMQVIREEADASGETKLVEHRWQELATGLNRWDEQAKAYVPSEILWEQLDSGHVIARKTASQIILSPQLNDPEGAVELWGPENLHLRSSVLGIGVVDLATGQSYLLAQPKEKAPLVLSSTTDAWIEDAFDTLRADLRYRLRKDGLEQDLVLREKLAPELLKALGIDPKSARVFLMTEFFQPPAPVLKDTTSATPSGQLLGDAVVDFGSMQMGPGQAFAEEAAETGEPVRVGKEWKKLDGRQFLIESIFYEDLIPLMAKLASPDQARLDSIKSKVRRTASLPKPKTIRQANAPRFEQGRLNLGENRFVSARPEIRTYASLRGPGATLDYQLLSSTATLTLQGDVTYYVSDAVNVSSSLVIEGGAVVKATNSPTAGIVCLTGVPVTCLMDEGQMSVFTSKDDNTVGESIPGSTANPWTNYCASAGLELRLSGQNLHHLRFAHLRRGLFFYDYSAGTANTVSHAQFVHCGTAVQANGYGTMFANLNLRNVLVHDATNAIYGYSLTGRVEHLTAHRCAMLAWDYNGTNYGTTSTVYLTNSLLVSVTNNGNMGLTTNSTATVGNSNAVFQTVGAGGFYHLNNTHRGNGTTNINATLATELKSLTTYPPILMSNQALSTNLVLGQQVVRNTGVPDRGYHYQPIDVATCQLMITNPALLTLTNGVAIGTFGDAGLVLHNGGRLVGEGTPLNPIRIFRYNLIQEQSIGWGSTNYQPNAIVGPGTTNFGLAPTVSFRFTKFDGLANYGYHLYGGNGWFLFGSIGVRDCEFRNQKAELGGGSGTAISLNNNLFRRVQNHYYAWPQINAYNNLYWAGTNRFERFSDGASGVWHFHDNSFHDTGFAQPGGTVSNSHNAFIGIGQSQFATTQGNNIVLTNGFTYTNGPLGGYYHLSTNLLNVGSRSASLAGLYHFTTLASQAKETNSTVDIGWHRVALMNGAPADTDGDGTADYVEDVDGDGAVDPGEYSWSSLDTDGDGRNDADELLAGTNPLDPDCDDDGSNDGQEFVAGTDPWNPDTDNDGLNDGQEAAAGTNPLVSDTDYDGRSDGQELLDGTDPLDAVSAVPCRLAQWRFNGTNWRLGDRGQTPLVETNISAVTSFDGTALQLNSATSVLRYRDVESDGRANLNILNGSVAFWFKPSWNYPNVSQSARFFEVGSYPNGWWGIHVQHATGELPRLRIGSCEDGGYGNTMRLDMLMSDTTCTEAYSFASKWATPSWHQMALTWEPQEQGYVKTQLYTDSTLIFELKGNMTNPPNPCSTEWRYYGGSGIPTNQMPSLSRRTNGIAFGGASVGGYRADGLLDQVEFYNYPIGLVDLKRREWAYTFEAPQDSQTQLTLRRPDDTPIPCSTNQSLGELLPAINVYRRLVGSTAWTGPLTTTNREPTWVDTGINENTIYEYKLARVIAPDYSEDTILGAGVRLAPVHLRGKVILVVESALTNSLSTEIGQLQQDLAGDGWRVATIYGARHIDADSLGLLNENALTNTANAITTARDPALTNVVFILGHVTIPYSGSTPTDGHCDHRGPWTADGYYGFVDRTGWIHATISVDTCDPYPIYQNASSHRFINDNFPSPIDMAVGRVDFANLPLFIGASFLPPSATNATNTEIELLRQYLGKDHAFRMNEVALGPRVCAANTINNFDDALRPLVAKTAGPMFGVAPATAFNGVPFYQKAPCSWGIYFGYGRPDGQRIAMPATSEADQKWFSSTNHVTLTKQPSPLFYSLLGSYFIDWNVSTNNHARSLLGTKEGGLAALTWLSWRLEWLALGAPLADTMRGQQMTRFQSILGDPTLRLLRVSPVQGLGAVRNGSAVTLTWQASSEPDTTYYVYRSSDGTLNGFDAPLNTTALSASSYITNAGAGLYRVRACRLIHSGAGSFHCLSQSTFVTVN
jgi:hypothetical protein